MTPDLINGAFELASGLLITLNIRQLLRDRKVAGVHLLPTLVFTSWGIFNLWFYPALNLWFSFAGGAVLVLTNAIWLTLAWRYRVHTKTTA